MKYFYTIINNKNEVYENLYSGTDVRHLLSNIARIVAQYGKQFALDSTMISFCKEDNSPVNFVLKDLSEIVLENDDEMIDRNAPGIIIHKKNKKEYFIECEYDYMKKCKKIISNKDNYLFLECLNKDNKKCIINNQDIVEIELTVTDVDFEEIREELK